MVKFMKNKGLLNDFLFHSYFLVVAFFHIFEEDNSTFFKSFYIMLMIMMVLTSFVMALENIVNYKEKKYSVWLGTLFLAIELFFWFSLVKLYLL